VAVTAWQVQHGRYTEIPVLDKPLGRQRMTDSRSAAYRYVRRPVLAVKDTEWPRNIPILDQGNIGSCEGNAELGCAASGPIYSALGPKLRVLVGKGEPEALALYARATALDGYPGVFTYPPPGGEDTGTDSTSASKAAQEAGLISGYLHAADLASTLDALMLGPVNLGIDWYDSFDDPASDGLVEIAPSAVVRGGHALCARAVDAGRARVWLDNSWTDSWGVKGRCCMAFDTLSQLLETGGECVVPVPLSAPAPQPQPVPPGPLAEYLADARLAKWAGARHVLDNAYAAKRWLWLKSQPPG
jgi:hypothetical protein